MVADIVEVIFINHISNFVQLNARFLRVNFGFPADVDHNDAFVCGVGNKYDGYWNVASCSEQNRDWLKRENNSINQTNEPKPHTRRLIQNVLVPYLIQKAAIQKVELSCDGQKAISHCNQHLKAKQSVDLLRHITNFIVCST